MENCYSKRDEIYIGPWHEMDVHEFEPRMGHPQILLVNFFVLCISDIPDNRIPYSGLSCEAQSGFFILVIFLPLASVIITGKN